MSREYDVEYEVILHEKRYAAEEKVDKARPFLRKAKIACAIGFAALFAVMAPFMVAVYDREMVLLLFCLFALYFLLAFSVYFIYGAYLYKSLSVFLTKRKYVSHFDTIIERFDELEIKYAEKTLRHSEMEEFEEKMEKLFDEINEKM